jgi:hypothetical protein
VAVLLELRSDPVLAVAILVVDWELSVAFAFFAFCVAWGCMGSGCSALGSRFSTWGKSEDQEQKQHQ